MTTLDFSKPDQLQTRDGRAVRIYATDGNGVYCVHGAIKYEGGWVQERWGNEGTCFRGSDASDLIRKPARITGWANVYPNCTCFVLFATKEEAISNASKDSRGQIYVDAEVHGIAGPTVDDVIARIVKDYTKD